MNTVDALNEFGMALCGDGFVPQPDRTDAETINDIAEWLKNNGGIGSAPRIIEISNLGDIDDWLIMNAETEPGLSKTDICNSMLHIRPRDTSIGITEQFGVVIGSAYSDVSTNPDGVNFVGASVDLSTNAFRVIRLNYNPVTGFIQGSMLK